MAAALNMDRATYHRLEKGERRYLVEDAIAASKFLGVSLLSVTIKPSPGRREAA
jgi:transcriptional regulator with XRE-family HTH domain